MARGLATTAAWVRVLRFAWAVFGTWFLIGCVVHGPIIIAWEIGRRWLSEDSRTGAAQVFAQVYQLVNAAWVTAGPVAAVAIVAWRARAARRRPKGDAGDPPPRRRGTPHGRSRRGPDGPAR